MSILTKTFAGIVFVLVLPLLGAPVPVSVSIAGAPDDIKSPAIEIHAARQEGAQREEQTVRAEDGAAIDLGSSGVWYLTPRAAGYYGETTAVAVPYAGAAVELKLWPAATLRATLAPKLQLKDVRVRFEPVVSTLQADRVPGPAGSSDCQIRDRQVECVIPAGRFDFSFRSFGHVPQYRWDQTFAPGTVSNLGVLHFRKGASLLGRITTPSTYRTSSSGIQVQLIPYVPAPRATEESRVRISTATVRADMRGRFIFEGIAPGEYELTATAPELVSARRRVTVIDGLEAELREPLALEFPRTLIVEISPPTDPWRERWTVELQSVDLNAQRGAEIGSGRAEPDGQWKRRDLTPGNYVVRIGRAQGTWHSHFVTLTDDTTGEVRIPLQIPLVRVAGRLLLGEMPIAGSIWFGGEHGDLSVPVRTAADGTFRAIIPAIEGNVWKTVEVAAERPVIRTAIHDLRLSDPDADGIVAVDIALPRTRLYGEVITTDGKPARDATVYAGRPGGGQPLYADVEDGGIFAFTGLAAGTYSVRAIGADGTSDATAVVMESDSDKYLSIVLQRETEVSGTVMSRYGAVAGARVSIYPEDRTGFGLLPWDRTDHEGRFRVQVAERQPRNMTVEVVAPGFAYTMFHLAAQPPQPLVISVEQLAGRLIVENVADTTTVFLFRGNGFVSMASLESRGVANRQPGGAVIPNVQPGHYDVCVATPARAALLARSSRAVRQCSGGFLPAHGSLTLALPSRQTGDR